MTQSKGWAWAIGLLAALGAGGAVQGQAPKVSAFKEPLALMRRASAAYAKVDDYSCLLIKREKLDGKMTPDNVIEMKVRKAPFSVAMKWQQPKNLVKQEAVYVEGLHGGKMRAKPAGLLGAIGFITIPIDDARAKKTSRHPISTAGIGRAIDEALRSWEAEEKAGGTATVKIGTSTFAKKKCTRLEITYSGPPGKRKYAKNIFYFDQATHLPIRIENFDWPAKGAALEVSEIYSFINMRLNVGLSSETFKK